MTGPRPESALYNALNGNANARALKAQDAVTQQAPRAADAIRLGLDTGLDPDLVLSNYDTIKAEVARPGFNAERFAKESPVVAAWAAQKPSRTALLRDDAEPLGMLERLIGRWEGMAPIGANIPGLGGLRVPVPMQTRRSLVQDEYAKGEAGIVAGRFGSRDRVGEIDLDDPTTRAEAERLLAAADAELPEATNLFERMVRGSANITPSLINSLASGVEGGLAGASTGAALAVVAGNAGPQALVPEEILTAPAAAATGYLVGSRAGSFLASQEIEGGLANLRFRLMRDANGEPMDKTLARAASTSYGLAAGVLDVVSLGTLVKPFEKAVAARLTREAVAQALTVPTTRAALVAGTKDWLKAVGSETITETAQQGVQLWTEQMAVGASNIVDGTDFDTVEFARVRDELAETFTQTLVSMALLGVPGGATTTFGQLAQVRQATQDQQFLKALGEGVSAVSFRENLPETLREVAEAITVDGAVRDLSIPVERFNVYWQEQGIDPAEVAAQVGLTEQYQQAMALASADLVIPMPLYIEKLAGTKHHAGLTPDLRLRPGALTAREAQALAKQAKLVTPEQQAEAKAIVEAARPDESSQRVFETTRAALVATGRYTEEQAVENARIDQAFFARLAPVFGTDAFSLYESRRGGVVGPQVAEPLFDAIKTLQRLEREKAEPARVAEAMQEVERLTQMARTGPMREQAAFHGTPLSLSQMVTRYGVTETADGAVLEQNDSGRPNAFILPGTGKDLIALMRTANASSFLHEMSHEYLEVLADAAALDTAPEWVKQDWATTLTFLGVTDRSEITTAQHEKWARTWEGWLSTGQAPSEALFGAFARFKVWFRGVYKAGVDLLKGQVNPDIAGVFSRLLASEEQIAAAEQASASPPLFESAEQAQATPAEFAALQVAQEEVRQRADASLTARLLAEQRRASLKWWHDERDRTRTEIEQEVNAEPDQQAAHFLRTGELLDGSPLPDGVVPMKLDRALLTARYGADVVKSLPRGVFATKGTTGADPDVVASMFGIASGDRLVADLQALEPRTKRIERRTDEAMNQQYPDLLKDSAALAQAAQDAYHESDAAAEAMVAELRLLGRRSGAPVTDAVPALRAQVADDIRGLPLNRVEPHRFQQAEAKAGRLAYEAARAQDFAKAQFWKRKQLLNHLYYGEARKAVERADNIARYAGKFERPGIRARLGKSGQMYLDQIDNLMEQYEFRRVGEKALAKRQSLVSWIESQKDAKGEDADRRAGMLQIDERVLERAGKTNYRQLSLDELEAVADAMAQIDHLSLTKTKLLASLRQRTFEETKEDVIAAIGSHHAITTDTFDYAPESFFKSARDVIVGFDAKHVRPEFLFRWLDGDQETGVVQETFFAPIVGAENAEHKMLREAHVKLDAIMSKVGTPKERAKWFSERIIVPGIPQSPFTKSNILSLALNWGNEDNRTAIRDGHKWTDQQVARILKTLTAADLAMVQELWDLIDSYWPEIAELQREMTGLVPAKVERVKFTVRSADGQDVQMNGGYYPLKYDSKRSFVAFSREQKANVKELFGTNNISPQTKKGHTIERVGSGGQVVSLDLGVLTGHIQNVVHDLTHRRALLDVDRLLNDKDVRAAIEGTAGKAAYKQLDPWLVNIASDRRDPAGAGERLVARARTGATVVNMGWKVTTAIVQPLGYLQTIELIGAKWTMRGVTATMGTPAEMKRTIEMILEKSEAMRNRQTSFDREVRDLYKKMAAKGPVSDVQQSFFYFTGLMDMVVAMPTWYGAYLKSMETMAPGDEAAAVAYADAMVRQSQGSGSAKDLAQVQQGSEYHRMFTMFYSYFSVLYNLMRRSVDRNVVNAETRNLPKFAASMALLWFAPAVLSELIAARGPGDDEDPLEWAAWKLAKYPLSSIVFVRDIVNAQGPDAYDYELSPVVAAGKTLAGTLNTAREVAVAAVTDDEVEITRADLKEAAMTAGYWGKLPARQMWITGEYLLRWMTGEEVPGSVPEAVKGVMFAPSR